MLMTPPRTESASALTRIAIAVALLAPFAIYFSTASSMVSIWNSSETFAHGYIILPISLWLIWQRRESLSHMTPAPYWPALLLLAACGFGWLLAELGEVQVVRQYAFVAMIPAAAVAMLGPRMSAAMAFPLLFLLLAVPFGEIFIAPLISFTADFTVEALQATGIPVLRDGTNFTIPSGNWSVVEACSGVRYLIASFTLGCLYAYLTYTSRARQTMFVLLSIVVPIIANGIRAYMIVMIGHLSGMKLAVGVDHLIYGWIFFGLVMFVMFWIGSFWREDQYSRVKQPMEILPEPTDRADSPRRMFASALAVLACLGIWPIYAHYVERAGFNPAPAKLAALQTQWQDSAPFTTWKPGFFNGNVELYRFFQRNLQVAGVSVKYYRNQNKDSKLISSANLLVQDKSPDYRHVATTIRHETIANRELAVREACIQGASGPLLVWYWYWIDGKFIANDYFGKLLQVKEKFLMGGDDGAAVMVFAPYADSQDAARSVLRDFLNENLGALEATLASNRKQ